MSTMKNDQISIYCCFNKIIKGPRTSFQSPAFHQKHVRNFCHTATLVFGPSFILIAFKRFQRNKHKCNFLMKKCL